MTDKQSDIVAELRYSYTGHESGNFIIWKGDKFIANIGGSVLAKIGKQQIAFDAGNEHAELIVNALNAADELERMRASLNDSVGNLIASIRSQGWMVAIHNDYMLHGESHTFWGFTKDGRFIKGEGRNDKEALRIVLTLSHSATKGLVD